MKSQKMCCLIIAILFSSGTSLADSGVPYQYGEFNGVINGGKNRQEVYGDFDGDGHLEHAISDPRGNRVIIFICHSNDYWINMDRINPRVHSMFAWDWLEGTDISCYKQILRTDSRFGSGIRPAEMDMGSSLAVGDFNGDGRDDLVIGAPTTSVYGTNNAGAVYVVVGHDSFPDSSVIFDIHQGRIGPWGTVHDTAELGDRFGSSLAVGDFNCDGMDDLAIGVTNEDLGSVVDAGMIHLLYGEPAPPSPPAPPNTHGMVFSSTEHIDQNLMPGQFCQDFEYFGASLASGRFNSASSAAGSRCYSLAVGAPGEDYQHFRRTRDRAGAAYVFLAASGDILRPTRYQHINQATVGVYDTPQANEMFATDLGTMSDYIQGYDGLWIKVSTQDFSSCTRWEHRPYHRFGSGPTGIITGPDSHYCGMFSPEVVEQRGVISEVETQYGSVAFFMPRIFVDMKGVGALIHGTYGDNSTDLTWDGFCSWDTSPLRRFAANEGVFSYLADLSGVALIIPSIEHDFFGVHRECMQPPPSTQYMVANGFRGTFGGIEREGGELWGFDEWLNFMVDELTKINPIFGERMYLYGHSGGGQFVSRYLWEHAERVNTAVISSPGGVLWPDFVDVLGHGEYLRPWPNGMGVYWGEQNWPEWGPDIVWYDPRWVDRNLLGRWNDILQMVHIHVVVEEADPRKTDTLRDWVNILRLIEPTPTFCVVEGSNHGTIFDGAVPLHPGLYYGDEAALSLFGYGVDTAGLCMEVIE